MAFILLVVGGILFYLGKVDFGGVQTEGKHVKVAGFILALPALLTLTLRFFIEISFGSNQDIIGVLWEVLAVFEILSMIAAGVIAYLLIINPDNAPRLPGMLGELQDGIPGRTASVTPPKEEEPQPQRRLVPRQGDFKEVMSVKEAAQYLQTTEAKIMALIDEGKLPAARINFNYRIAKSQLDEILKSDDESRFGLA